MANQPRLHDKKLQEEWAVPLKSIQDIYDRFMQCCLGKLKTNPWSELDGVPQETKIINEQLGSINLKGYLTINSQPAVNGDKSESPVLGWGGPGGYVYQKAYLEFFCAQDHLSALVEKAKTFPSLTYLAVNKDGNTVSNVTPTAVNAVTWGIFPAKEIIQPKIVDPTSFLMRKDEAFDIWTKGWASMYPEEDPSRTLLEQVKNSYYLVSLVDNDFVNGDLSAVFKEL